MQDKIYQYIKEKSAGIDSDEIVRVFFQMQDGYPPQMLDIVEKIMNSDPRFVRDTNNLWNINKEIKTLPLNATRFAVVDTDVVKLDAKQVIPSLIGILVFEDKELIFQKIVEIDYPFELSSEMVNVIDKQKEYLDVEHTTPENLEILYNHLSRSIIFHTAPARFISMINQLFRKRIGMELESQTFSIGQILKIIDPEMKINSFESMVDMLEIQRNDNPNLSERLSLRWAIVIKMIEKLNALEITTVAQLEEMLINKSGYVNFSDFNFTEDYIKNLPQKPGVYLMRSMDGTVFYVGKAKNLKNRVSSYFVNRTVIEKKMDRIFKQLFELTCEEAGSELEAMLLEKKYIDSFQPEVNTQIDVDVEHSAHIEKEDVIVFLPALEPEHISIFFVHKADTMYLRRVSKKIPDYSEIKDIIPMFFNDTIDVSSDYTPEQIELFWRWFSINKNNVSSIKPLWTNSADILLEKISEYVDDDDLLVQKLIHV